MPLPININKGDRFGKLSIVSETDSKYYQSKGNTKRCRMFNCICDCGNATVVSLASLRIGDTKSCGCNKIEAGKKLGFYSKKHGLSRSPLYKIYHDIKSRCFNSNHSEYHNYGGRGITVCKEWVNDFMVFYKWALTSGYRKGLEIDRKNNNNGYSPQNCRWVTRIVNSYNKRVTIMVEWEGEPISLGELCSKLKLNKVRVYQRMRRGMTLQQAIEKPLRNYPIKNTDYVAWV